ncbi:hypothetical protein BGZ60DRAFT_437732 [Tricladium varicosporioides]|nr:hypothetical protein BGZ60DRAFT_437732 [Hymenoscyphus varicosporioides]
MPLVPEPFRSLSISRQGLFSSQLYGSNSNDYFLANSFCNFLPNPNIRGYRERLTEKERDDLDQRADKLKRNSVQSYFDEVSESTWEADVRSDVFGKIRDDSRLRIDKRPYQFVERDEDGGNVSVKKRIPDATLGLRAYSESQLKKGFECTAEGCTIDHSIMNPHEALSQQKLLNMTNQRQSGLVVDGVWGKADIIFPWAIYEAKKTHAGMQKAEDQIYHACKTYLAMLDDLARDPEDVTQYQSEESKRFQMFCFTSSGPLWGVYVVYPFIGSCHVETIWEGNVTEFSRAYDLICLTDQIAEYAATQHRNFVIKHLKPWHDRHDKFFKSFHEYDPDEIHLTGWELVQCHSKDNTNKKADEKKVMKHRVEVIEKFLSDRKHQKRRLRNDQKQTKNIRRGTPVQDGVMIPAKTADVRLTKRGRGRPKKVPSVPIVKRGRGRPRKITSV